MTHTVFKWGLRKVGKSSPTRRSTVKVPNNTLHRIFVRGHKKVDYKKANGELMMLFSDHEHKHIAKLIAHWLNESDNSKG
ncbi:hypothetical protein EP12_09275 [Alteromonas australica]|nr:hypothetical protein EP12_09275 [Alteromonas australica]